MEKKCNILQYEFFHVGVGGRSLEAVLAECLERAAESLPTAMAGDDTGPGIKTCVRIYDTDDEVTRLVIELNALKDQYDTCLFFAKDGMFARWRVRRKRARLDHRMQAVKGLIKGYFIAHMGAAFNEEKDIAREIGDHAFRLARREEYDDLRQSAIMAKRFWLFVFANNDLLADENEIVTHMM